MRHALVILAGLALGLLVYLTARGALVEHEPVILHARAPISCLIEWVDADGDLVGTGCEVQP